MISGACIAQHDLASLSATVRRIVIETGSRFMLHGPLQFLRRSECDLLAGFDLDGLSGSGVPPRPSRPPPHSEDAEACQADFVAPLEMACGQRHQIAQHGLSLLPREVMAVCQRGGQMLERDRSLRRSFRWDCLRRNGGPRCGGSSFLRWRHRDLLLGSIRGNPARTARVRAILRQPVINSFRDIPSQGNPTVAERETDLAHPPPPPCPCDMTVATTYWGHRTVRSLGRVRAS